MIAGEGVVNRLLGEDRLVVSDEAGTTRDAIDTPMRYHERTIVFIDTAGLRRIGLIAWGAVVLALVGFAIELVFWNDPATAAALLEAA